MSRVNEIMQTFFAESGTLLEQMEEALLQLQDDGTSRESLDALFRAAHTIKGSAGLFGFDDVVAFTHTAESVLVRVRDGALQLDDERIELLLQCADHLRRLLDVAASQGELDAQTRHTDAQLSVALQAMADAAACETPAALPVVFDTAGSRMPDASEDDVWHISVRFGLDLFRKGLSPTPVLRHLATLGELAHVCTLHDTMPHAAEMDAESCYLGLELRLRGNLDKATIENAFEFVADDCALRILPPGSCVEDYIRLLEVLPEDRSRLGELLLACGAVTRRELDMIVSIQQCERADRRTPRPLGEIAVEHLATRPEVVDAALAKQRDSRRRGSVDAQMLRVQAAKLDGLIDKVGELVIASAGVGQQANRLREPGLVEAVSGLARLVEDIRDSAMRLRLVEIGETFTRFRRVVHDVSRQLGKDIELVISGAETELDKSLVEQISDPLTHLVRNAIDHGVEMPDARVAAGKPARARLHLSASHESSSIVIEVADDGRGLDRDRIVAKAMQQGLIQSGEGLDDEQVWELIFAAGFSTADKVSDLSGRGVGMDVVRRNIQALRGSIQIESSAGAGSTFRIRLPLTLAIIDGFLVRVGDSHYVAPLDSVIECVEFDVGALARGYLNLRGEVLPLLPLRRHFNLAESSQRRQSVVVVSAGGHRAGLVVDQLHGELQTVIKPLGPLFSRLAGIAGSTILGSGEVALVLDVPALLGGACRAVPLALAS